MSEELKGLTASIASLNVSGDFDKSAALVNFITMQTQNHVQNYIMTSSISKESIQAFIEHKAKAQARELVDELFNFIHHDQLPDLAGRSDDQTLVAIQHSINKGTVQEVKSSLMKVLLQDLGVEDRLLEAWIDDDVIPDELKETILIPLLKSITVQT